MSIVPVSNPLVCDHGLRRHSIVQSLLADVVQGNLRAGQHLTAQELARRFGVSHTPIREALIALAGIGVIDLLPNRGAVVRQVTTREVREVCQVRRALECEATRTACGRIEPAELMRLAADLRGLIAPPGRSINRLIEKARDIDTRLHDLVANSCGNAFLAEEIGRFKLLFRAFRDMSYVHHAAENDRERLIDEAKEHLAVVETLLAGDRKAAVRAMSRHIKQGITYWSRSLPKSAQSPKRAVRTLNGKHAKNHSQERAR